MRRNGLPLLIATVALSSCGAFSSPQQRIDAARRDMTGGDWSRAAFELGRVLHSDPKNAAAWQLLAEVSLDAADLSGATSALTHARTAGARGPKFDALSARIWLAAGEPQKVVDAIGAHTLNLPQPDLALELARAYLALGQAPKAKTILQTVLAQHPQLEDAHLVMAQAQARTGELDAALQQLDTAMRADPKSSSLPALQGWIFMWQGQYAAAERSLELAWKRMPPGEPVPDRAQTLIPLTEARLSQGEIDAAAQSQAALSRLLPTSPLAKVLGARIKMARGDFSHASDDLQWVTAQAPNYLEARFYLGAAELARGNLQQAQDELEQVVQQSPNNLEARELLATVRMKLGQSDALSLLTPVLESQPADPQLLALVGAAASRPGGAAELQSLEQQLRAHPENRTLRLNLAHAYLGVGHPKDALALLSTAVTRDRTDVPAAIELARLQSTMGNSAGAKSTFDSALAANPQSLPLRLAYAGLLAGSPGSSSAALKVLQGAPASQGGPALDFALARVYLDQGDVARADAALDRAIAAQPGRAPVIEDAGVLLLGARQYDAALARLVRAAQLAPDNALYLLNAARAQLAVNQPIAARTSLERVAQLRPNWLPAVGMLAEMDLRAKDGHAALDRVNALLASTPRDAGALALKGYVESALGDTGAASAAYTRAQEQRPSALVAVKLFQLRLAGHDAEPQQPLEQWLARAPGDGRVHEILGEYYLHVHAWRQAAGEFETVIRIAPGDLVALNNLAWTYGQLNDPRGQDVAERAHQLAPDSPAVDDTLGWILARRGESMRALTLLAQAAKMRPTDSDIEYHYAYALSKAGKRDEARQILTRLLSTAQPFDSRADAQRMLAAMKAT